MHLEHAMVITQKRKKVLGREGGRTIYMASEALKTRNEYLLIFREEAGRSRNGPPPSGTYPLLRPAVFRLVILIVYAVGIISIVLNLRVGWVTLALYYGNIVDVV